MKKTGKSLLSVVLSLAMMLTMLSVTVVAEEKKADEVTTQALAVTAEAVMMENEIDILTLNDFHGNVKESGKNIGMAKMVGYVNDAKAKNPNTIVVSGGDNYQGTAISNLTFGAPVNDMFKAMGLVASAVGNHDFDWGTERISKWSEDGGFPYLSANIYDKRTNKPVDWAKPYLIKEIDGLKIAFIGLSTEQTAYQVAVDKVANYEFKSAKDGAKIWVDYLKAGKAPEGTPDLIIALTHVPSFQDSAEADITGDEIKELCSVEGLDAVISGHSHRTVAGLVNGVPVVQAYKYGRSVGKLAIKLNADKTVASITPSVEAVYKFSSDIVEDEETAKVFAKYEAEFTPIASEVVGKLDRVMSHERTGKNLTELGYWTTDMMRKAAGTDIGLTNGGGIRRTLEAGNVTMGDMYEIMPFDNTLVTMNVTGAELKKLIDHGIEADFMTDGQFAGVKVTYDPKAEYENRIVTITLEDGSPLDMDATYSLATNDFAASGGDKYDFSNATDLTDTFIPIRDVLVKEFKAVDMIKVPDITGIITVAEEKMDTTVYMIQYGDVLWKIARDHGTTYEELAKLNNLANPHMIYAGKKLLVPAK